MIADCLSRPNQPITTEWSLHPKIVNRIFGTWGEGGHVCHSPQHASSSVYVCSSGALSTGDRCSVTRLAGEVDVHVSTVSPAQQSHSETQENPGGQIDTNSPLVAITTVVSISTMSVCVDHPLFFPYCRDLLSQQGYVSDGKSYHLHAWRLSCSTIKQQDFQKRSLDSPQLLKGPLQSECMTTGGFASLTMPQDKELIRLVPQLLKYIAAFLYDLFDTHSLSPQTIKGYRSFLASVLTRTGNAAAIQAKTISDMITSMELQIPRMTPVLPQWDLGFVLEALSKPPYELLREVSLKHLTLKTVFLLAMASARRCSELQALVFDLQYIYTIQT